MILLRLSRSSFWVVLRMMEATTGLEPV